MAPHKLNTTPAAPPSGTIAVTAYVPARELYFDPVEPHTFRCVAVDDGDGVTLEYGLRTFQVRLWGIDAPEYDQQFGTEAKEMLFSLAHAQHLYAQPVGLDRYGRTLAVLLTLRMVDIGAKLVQAGLAWAYTRYTGPAHPYVTLEIHARQLRQGLWSLPRPVEPWVHRRRINNPNRP